MKITSLLSAAALSILLAVFSPLPAAQAQTGHPAFFADEIAVGDGYYYLQLPDGTPFGFYTYDADDSHYIYHVDAGVEYVYDVDDGAGGVYFYDFQSGGVFYTSNNPNFPFPYIYNYNFAKVLYYFPDANRPYHYTTGPRYFYLFLGDGNGEVITD